MSLVLWDTLVLPVQPDPPVPPVLRAQEVSQVIPVRWDPKVTQVQVDLRDTRDTREIREHRVSLANKVIQGQ